MCLGFWKEKAKERASGEKAAPGRGWARRQVPAAGLEGPGSLVDGVPALGPSSLPPRFFPSEGISLGGCVVCWWRGIGLCGAGCLTSDLFNLP